MKVVEKNLVRSITATSVSKDSIARFFIPNAQLTSPPSTIGVAKVSKQELVWHSQVTPPPAAKPLQFQPVIGDEFHDWGGSDRGDEEDTISVEMDFSSSPPFGKRSEHIGDGSALTGEGSTLLGEGSTLLGEGSALLGKGSALSGEALAFVVTGSAVDIEQFVPPQIPKGHVVLQRKGNKVVTGPHLHVTTGYLPLLRKFFHVPVLASAVSVVLLLGIVSSFTRAAICLHVRPSI